MDPRLLDYFERELKHVRELGGEFAKEFPKIAGRLGLDAFDCADPYVERLIEAFAFLTARVHLKLDSEFSVFTRHMLELLYPGYLAPVPSLAVVQMRPNLREGSLVRGVEVPRGAALRSRFGASQTPCEYRTAHPVTLWPIELVAAEYRSAPSGIAEVERAGVPPARAALHLRLRASGGATFDRMPLRDLPLFLRGTSDTAMRLYEHLLSASTALVVHAPEGPARERFVVAQRPLAPMGFEDEEALLPCGARSFQGHRLLQEYFAFPERFRFVRLSHLELARNCKGSELEVIVTFKSHEARFEGLLNDTHLALYCTPAINLFPRTADNVVVSRRDFEHHLVPDRNRRLDFEIHSVTQVRGVGTQRESAKPFLPMYAPGLHSRSEEHHAYYNIRREGRMLSKRERDSCPRTDYVPSEVFLTLVDGEHGPGHADLRQLEVETLCTNRALPLQMSLGKGESDFTEQSGAPVESVRCVAGPTAPRSSAVDGELAWRLLSHLQLDYLTLLRDQRGERVTALRDLLGLYATLADPASRRQIEGVSALETRAIVRPLPFAGPVSFGRGVEFDVTLDESSFEGSGVFLLGSVLAQFFARYASINTFTETLLRTKQRGELHRWPAAPGRRHVV